MEYGRRRKWKLGLLLRCTVGLSCQAFNVIIEINPLIWIRHHEIGEEKKFIMWTVNKLWRTPHYTHLSSGRKKSQ